MAVQSVETKEIERAFEWLSEFWDRPIHPDYLNASTTDEAISLLEQYGGEARIFAGGTDLIGLMKNKVLSPSVLVNIKPIKILKRISLTASGVAIGALTRINELERSPIVRSQYRILLEAARSIASPHIRNMATVGGNLCQETRCWYYRRPPDTGISFNCRRKSEEGICYALDGENQYHAITGERGCVSVCPSDLATVLLAMDAKIKIANKRGGRIIPIEKFYTGFGKTLDRNEIISAIQIPKMAAGVKQRFLKFRLRKTIDFAIVSVAAIMKLEENRVVSDARIALGGVSSEPYRVVNAEQVLIGRRLTQGLAAEAAKASVIGAKPLSKNGYKVPIVEALVRRALLE